jgi:hypothetical protein
MVLHAGVNFCLLLYRDLVFERRGVEASRV